VAAWAPYLDCTLCGREKCLIGIWTPDHSSRSLITTPTIISRCLKPYEGICRLLVYKVEKLSAYYALNSCFNLSHPSPSTSNTILLYISNKHSLTNTLSLFNFETPRPLNAFFLTKITLALYQMLSSPLLPYWKFMMSSALNIWREIFGKSTNMLTL
jgi:hypothetical protein